MQHQHGAVVLQPLAAPGFRQDQRHQGVGVPAAPPGQQILQPLVVSGVGAAVGAGVAVGSGVSVGIGVLLGESVLPKSVPCGILSAPPIVTT